MRSVALDVTPGPTDVPRTKWSMERPWDRGWDAEWTRGLVEAPHRCRH